MCVYKFLTDIGVVDVIVTDEMTVDDATVAAEMRAEYVDSLVDEGNPVETLVVNRYGNVFMNEDVMDPIIGNIYGRRWHDDDDDCGWCLDAGLFD